jgi:hypothetical protein
MVLVLFLIFSIFTLKSPLADTTVNLKYVTNYDLCQFVSKITTSNGYPEYFKEAKRRGLSCGVNEKQNTDIADSGISVVDCSGNISTWNNCFGTYISADGHKYVGEYKGGTYNGQGTFFYPSGAKYVGEFEDGKFNGQGTYAFANGAAQEGVWKDNKFQYAKKLTPSISNTELASSTNNQSNTPTSAEFIAAQRKAEELEQQLAALKSSQQKQQQTISSDTQIPLITITSASSSGPTGTIEGRVKDNTGVGEVRVDGQLIQVDDNGNFTANTYVPEGGVSVIVEAVDVAGLSSSMSVRLDRVVTQSAAFSFDRLNPIKRKASSNPDALALIVGVDNYERTPARAIFADSDAKVFADYASEKLGIPSNRIKTLVNDGADEQGMLLAVKDWLARSVKQGDTDVYVFFAGHGLASDDGKQMYLLPYDGSPRLLEKTAILREELFDDISSSNPRSVTVFLDTCYSGTTRGTDVLITSRPIALKVLKQSLPDNFTVLTAAAGDQTAKPLKEAKHGMFSYFLMKGMEGEADANQDNQITAGELHQYVQSNVVQQSSGSQTPELQGDADRVLVQFQ